MANALLNPKMYAKISGFALLATAILGFIVQGPFIEGFLDFDLTHNIVHVVLALIALGVGFAGSDQMASLYAKIFGIVYFTLGVVGFIPGIRDMLHDIIALDLELGENLVHLVIGLWGIGAGFFGAPALGPPTGAPRRA